MAVAHETLLRFARRAAKRSGASLTSRRWSFTRAAVTRASPTKSSWSGTVDPLRTAAQESWTWGTYPTTITKPRQFGEICFRQIGNKFVFTFLDLTFVGPQIRAQVLSSPTANLFTTLEQ